jgi:hypothetical protein
MAEVISTTGKDENYEMISKKIKEMKKQEEPIKMEDPMKTCMTRTIVPVKREVEKRDIDRFVNRVKGIKEEKKDKQKTKKEETPVIDNIIKEEKKRGRPKTKAVKN